MKWQFDKHKLLYHGETLYLNGAGIGNWMLLESFMHGLPGLHSEMLKVMEDELGQEKACLYWESYFRSYISEKDIICFSEHGGNFLRVPFHQKLLQHPVYGPLAWECLDQLFVWAEKYKIFILLDMHAVEGGQSTDWYADCEGGITRFWEDKRLQQKAIKLWVQLVNRYKDQPMLLGYDLLNEPVTRDANLVNDYYLALIAEIRKYDRHSVIQIEPNLWARDAKNLKEKLFEDDLVMIQGHFYSNQHFAMDRLLEWSSKPTVIDDSELLEAMETTYLPKRFERPAMMGEFGCQHFANPEPSRKKRSFDMDHGLAYATRQQARILREAGVHRCLWSLKDRGKMGLIHAGRQSAWSQFLRRDDINEPLGELARFTKCAFGANASYVRSSGGEIQKKCHELFPDLHGEIVPRQVMDSQRALNKLALIHVVKKMSELREEDLLAMAHSFHFEQCEVQTDYFKILSA